MPNIFLTSDWHFGHDREFIWGPRGFNSIGEHDAEIITRHNSLVKPDDDVYVLGDLMLGDNEHGLRCINRMNGKLHIMLGNHDTEKRKELYIERLDNLVQIQYATMFKWNGYHFYCSHYPSYTGNLERESLKQMTLDLFGHTHQKSNFYQDIPFMYHVGLDSHHGYPVEISEIVRDMNAKVDECKGFLKGGEEDYQYTPIKEMIKRTAPKCNKCVWQFNRCGGVDPYSGNCPPGITYKRDPPDGGYYG